MSPRIASIEAMPVRVPRRRELLPRTAHGEVTSSDYVLLRLRTDEGVAGLGEVTCEPRWNGEEWAGAVSLVRKQLATALLDQDLCSWAQIATRLDRAVRGRPFLRAGVEMACLDALGRTLGVSVATLLGGALRDHIATRIVLPARGPDQVAAMAFRVVQRGTRAFKVKVGLGVDEDIARVAAVRAAVGPEPAITVDANEGWTSSDAIAALGELQRLGVRAVEQPLARSAWTQMAALRARSSVATVGDESIWQITDVLRAARGPAFDVVSVYPGKCGGITECVTIARLAERIGLTVAFGSNLELGVGAAAAAHAAAAAPALDTRVPADLIGPLYFEHSLITDASFVRWDGASIPGAHGLGVELDDAAVENHLIRDER